MMRTAYKLLRKGGNSRLGKRLAGFAPLTWPYHRLIAWHVARVQVAEVDGHTIFLDRYDGMGLLTGGRYEHRVMDLAKQIILPGDVVLDLGAMIGYHTLLFARLVGKEGIVFAFEPAPRAFALLRKNVLENKYENVTLVRKGVSERSLTARFRLTRSGFGGEVAASKPLGASNRFIDVTTTTLDDYFRDFNRPITFMKLDIEGSEYQALQGAQALLERNPELAIVAEFNPPALRRLHVEPVLYLQLLTTLGFDLFHIAETLERIDDVEAFSARVTGYRAPNLLGLRPSHSQRFAHIVSDVT